MFKTGKQLLLAVLLAAPLAAQNAALVGTVKDPAGAVVPNVRVILTNVRSGVTLSTTTAEDGNYEFPAVRPGDYSLKVERAEFKTFVQGPFALLVDQRARMDVSLEVGTVNETVNVTGEAIGVNTESSSIGEVIDTKKIVDIPLNGRFFLDLALLSPGTVLPSTNNRTFLAVPTSGGALGLNSSGAREDSANYLFDGVNLSDMVQNQITFLPNVEVIQEFKVQTNSFSSEYGRNAGIIVNAVTKSGGNQVHGSAFEFLRNDKLDARNFFDQPRPVAKQLTGREIPPFKRNIFGFSVGGPVMLPKYDGRNKTFFFTSFEGRRQRESDTFRATVPTEAQRAAVTDPAVKKLLTLVPLPNSSGTLNFAGDSAKPRDADQVSGKIDHMIGEKNTLSGTYIFQRDSRIEPSGIGAHNIPGFGDFRPAHRQIFAFRYTRVVSPRVTNEARFGINRVHITFQALAPQNPADFGMDFGVTNNFPDIRVAGGPAFGGFSTFPQGRSDTLFQYTDTLTWIRGSHSFKIGGEVRRFRNNNFANATGGLIRFSSLAAFLAGQTNQTTLTPGAITGIRVSAYNGFVQDDYKVTPRLTLNLGLRYEFNGVPGEQHNRFSILDLTTRQFVQVGAGIDRPYERDWNNFGPRIGFSFDPLGHGKTVIRGGYGLYFDQPVTNSVTGLGSNPPFARSLQFTDADPVAPPNISLSNPFSFPGGGPPPVLPAAVARNLVSAYVEQYNLNIQHERWNTVWQVGYVGSAGRHLRITRDINQGVGGVRPVTGFGAINLQESSSRSNYNGLWASANRRLARGLTFTASYTFSKSIDLNSVSSSNPQIQNANNLNAEKALSDFDARHRFVTSGIYQLPFHSDSAAGKRLVDGWSLAGIFNYQSGNPFSPIISTLRSGSGNLFDRPDIVPGQAIALDNPTPNLWFNTGAFVLNPAGRFGNAGRNIITSPDFRNLDLAVLKNIPIHERMSVQFRSEFFNISNHPNFGQPGNVVGTGTFGVISATRSVRGDLGSSRQIEFALKLLF